MAQSSICSHPVNRRLFALALVLSVLFGGLITSTGSAQDLPAICRRRGVYEAIRTLIRFCPSGNCIPRAGVGDLLESRVDPAVLQQIASDAALYPARIFYRSGRGRFDATGLVSSDHFAHAQADLREVARTYQRYPNSKIIVLGRASRTGDVGGNIRLSQERARRVADYLHSTFNISYDDIHQAYFGSHLFQMQASDLESLGIAADDLPPGPDGHADVALAANQSTVAFVFPCPETMAQQHAEEVEARERETEGCPLDEDAGVPQPAAAIAPPPAPAAPACTSLLDASEGAKPTRVYLMGGRRSALFHDYITALGARAGGRSLTNLVVFSPVAGAAGAVEWRSTNYPGNWFTQEPQSLWERRLGDETAPIAVVPTHTGKADIFCGQNPPTPLTSSSACGCRAAGSAGMGGGAWGVSLVMAVATLAVRRRHSRRSIRLR